MVELSQLLPTNEELFYRSHDENDPRLGTHVERGPEKYEEADIVLIGVPTDEGVRRNKGRIGSRFAPREIRRALYRLALNRQLEKLRILDLGDVMFQDSLEATHEALETLMKQLLSDDKIVVVMGGGNDISYPNCSAMSGVFGQDIGVFNIDKHYDVRKMNPRNSGTPYRMLLEEQKINPALFYELASEPFANSRVYKEYLEEMGVHVIELNELRKGKMSQLVRKVLEQMDTKAIFWGFDMDAVRASDAPGVSAPSPTGLHSEEIIELSVVAGKDPRSKVFEITEVNPRYDVDNRTSKLAAIMIYEFLSNLPRGI